MLTTGEKNQLVELLGKLETGKDLPVEIFEALGKAMPFVACELVVINDEAEILLTYRDDKYWQGWHIPGGILRYREKIEDRLNKTATAELGSEISSFDFITYHDYSEGLRSHDVSLIFAVELKQEPKEGKFFSQMPKDIIEAHRPLWDILKNRI